jgi:hypothetical protein
MNSPQEQKKRERASPSHGKKAISLTAPLMSPACKSRDLIVIRGLEQASPANTIFLYIIEASCD